MRYKSKSGDRNLPTSRWLAGWVRIHRALGGTIDPVRLAYAVAAAIQAYGRGEASAAVAGWTSARWKRRWDER